VASGHVVKRLRIHCRHRAIDHEENMLIDLILNILGPVAAKRYPLVRKGLWAMLACFLLVAIYRGMGA
jgi:hypothetical protein